MRAGAAQSKPDAAFPEGKQDSEPGQKIRSEQEGPEIRDPKPNQGYRWEQEQADPGFQESIDSTGRMLRWEQAHRWEQAQSEQADKDQEIRKTTEC